jgi:hypothetical protein
VNVADFTQLVTMLREQMSSTLSRSDVLKPLAWLIGILTGATALFLYAKAPDWLIAALGASLLTSVFLYFGSYLFCLFKDRDALRSEKYSLNKMAIQHGVYGDSSVGIVPAPALESRAIAAPALRLEKSESEPLEMLESSQIKNEDKL